MTLPWFLVAWFVTTVAFTGWVDNHRQMLVKGTCASDREWVRHPDCNPDPKQIIRTATGEKYVR
jgi:hypothetical protein